MATQNKKACTNAGFFFFWLREKDLNLRPLGYEATNHTCCSSGLIGEPRHPLSVQAQK